jgi:invasion protein IalB
MTRLPRLTSAGLLAAALLAATPALAQEPEPRTRDVGAWLLSCVDARKETARCEITQRVVDETDGQQILLASVAATREASPQALVFTTPLGVWLEPGANIVFPDRTGLTLPYERCAPNGCMIVLALTAQRRALLTGGGLAEIRFPDRLRRPLAAPISLDGFADALAALERDTAAPRRRGLANWFRRLGGDP